MTGYQIAFGIILGTGLLWLLVSVFLGDLIGGGDADGGVDGGDIDGADAGAGVDSDGGADGGVDGGDTGGGHEALHGPSWTSSSVIAAALVGIGGVGLASVSLGLNGWVALGLGLVIGLLFAYLILRFILRPLMRQQANTAISQRTYIGTRATVTLDVAQGRVGNVRFTDVNGAIVEIAAVPANSEDHFVRGDLVVIHSVVSGKARVIAFDAPRKVES